MPLAGTFSTMTLPDLLQWIGGARKTGTLLVERNRATKAIRVRDGRVIGSSSDDPQQRLGQFLLSRKRITEEQLLQALTIGTQAGELLGQVLVEMGALDSEELRGELRAKAEEIIYSLFDWDEGVFRFEETVDDQDDVFPVDLRIDDILLRGVKRYDDMTMIRGLLHSPGIVLRYTSKPPGPDIFSDDSSRAMYAAIDGERTLAEILLHVHGSEYQVKKFFYDLHEGGFVEIAKSKEREAVGVPCHSPRTRSAASCEEPGLELSLEPVPDLDLELQPVRATPGPAGRTAAAGAPTLPLPGAPTSILAGADELGDALTRANRMMTAGEIEGALDILNALYRESPADDALRRLTAEAEAAFVEKAYRHYLPANQVPILTRPADSLSSERLTPEEFFLLSRIDGTWDVRSIIQVAPFREVDALRTLKRMREIGMIELCDPP